MREVLGNPNASYEHRSSRFQRAVQHLKHVQEEMDAEAQEQAQERGDKRSKGKERAGTQKPGGESSGTQNTGGEGSGATGGTTCGRNNPLTKPSGRQHGKPVRPFPFSKMYPLRWHTTSREWAATGRRPVIIRLRQQLKRLR